MSKKYKKIKKGEKFIGIYGGIYNSLAWNSLSANAKVIFLEFKWRFNGRNNGEISLSLREAATICKIGRNKALIAILELLYAGFIRVEKIGMFTMNEATTFKLTFEEFKGNKATNDWRLYPENIGNKIKAKSLNGYCKYLDEYLQNKINIIL